MHTGKRRFKRVTITSVADIMLVNEKEKFRAFVGGISRGGMEIYTQRALIQGNEVQISLRFIDVSGDEKLEVIRGKIIWTNQFSDAHVAGLEFSEAINDRNYPALLTYLEQAEKVFTQEL
jgi:c-di-GMP-binding flagellar brake protein YcgR